MSDRMTQALAEIRFYPPQMSGRQLRGHAIPIDEHIYREYLAPLPRDREVPFAPLAYQKAAEMQKARKAIIDDIAQQLAAKLLEFIESEDPQHGYSPKEWAQIRPDDAELPRIIPNQRL